MATKTIPQLVALDNVSTNLSSTLFVVYDSESGTTRKASLSQIDTAIERTIQNVSSAAVYANAAFDKANVSNVHANAAFAVANTLFDGTAYANVVQLTSRGGVLTSFIANEIEGVAFLNLNPEYDDIRLGNDNGDVQISAGLQSGTTYYYRFSANGNLILPGNLYANSNVIHADTVIANTVTSVNVISSNILTANNMTVSNNFSVSGVTVQWHPAPLTSKGHAGDKAGFVAIDNDKIYRCVADYTDGNADIWRYINFTGGTWG